MTKTYEDPVNRTFELYGSQIGEALTQLKEDPNFGRYELSPESVVEAKFDGNSVTGISWFDVKKLEAKVQELTGDPKAQLVRKVAKFEADQNKATLTCYDYGRQWLDEKYRIDEEGNLNKEPMKLPAITTDPRDSSPSLGVFQVKPERKRDK